MSLLKKRYIGLIPARSKSKSLENKNIKLLNGKPMLVWSIEHSLNSKHIDKTYIWTDNKHYEKIAINNGANSIGLRTKYINDKALDRDMLKDFVKRYKKINKLNFDAIVLVRPTYPIRSNNLINQCIKEFDKFYNKIDSLRTVIETPNTPFKMWRPNKRLKNNIFIINSLSKELSQRKEYHSYPRQYLPQIFFQNACIDIIKVKTLFDLDSSAGNKVLGFKMKSEDYDIDNPSDFARVSNIFNK